MVREKIANDLLDMAEDAATVASVGSEKPIEIIKRKLEWLTYAPVRAVVLDALEKRAEGHLQELAGHDTHHTREACLALLVSAPIERHL